MLLQTMLDVLKYDSKFKDQKAKLLPILRRAAVNNLPQWEFAKYRRSGQRYENIELSVPVLILDEANMVQEDFGTLCVRRKRWLWTWRRAFYCRIARMFPVRLLLETLGRPVRFPHHTFRPCRTWASCNQAR